MRISELAQQSGLPVATIKFYLREGLLAPGTPISRTQAEYSKAHLERLRLIRALRDIADLPVATVGTVLAAVDDEEIPLLDLLGVTQIAVAGFKGSTPPTETGTMQAAKLLADLDWTLTEDSPLVESLARVLDVLHGEGEPVDVDSLRPWADAARAVAEVEMDHIPVEAPRAEAAHIVAVGTVIYGELLAQLRLAAQEAVGLERYGPQLPAAGTPDVQDAEPEDAEPEDAEPEGAEPEDAEPEDARDTQAAQGAPAAAAGNPAGTEPDKPDKPDKADKGDKAEAKPKRAPSKHRAPSKGSRKAAPEVATTVGPEAAPEPGAPAAPEPGAQAADDAEPKSPRVSRRVVGRRRSRA